MSLRKIFVLTALFGSLVAVSNPTWADEPANAPAAEGKGEKKPQTAGTKTRETKVDVVATEEGEEGVKTYQFGAVEVEGRLRSPQILHFLRRVRAEFAAAGLGHRSFMLELSDTQRHSAFR